jgi:oligoribonuclease NrnB/cAMP/cGMP phosphodiesterase (DHH superfamily)
MNLIITHAGCYDGSCSAWLLQKTLGGTIIPCHYGTEREKIGRKLIDYAGEYDRVFITDFSFDSHHLLGLLNANCGAVVLDHHKSAAIGLDLVIKQYPDRVFFDMNRCGAKMTFDYLVQHHPVELKHTFNDLSFLESLIGYVQDRDLWTWNLPDSKGINSVLRTYGHDQWEEIHRKFSNGELRREMVPIVRLERRIIDSAKSHAYEVLIPTLEGPRIVPCVNQTLPTLMSEIVGELAEESDYGVAIGWFYDAKDNKYIHSIRSRGEVDVRVIAESFGGGGHKNSAGFTLNTQLEVAK